MRRSKGMGVSTACSSHSLYGAHKPEADFVGRRTLHTPASHWPAVSSAVSHTPNTKMQVSVARSQRRQLPWQLVSGSQVTCDKAARIHFRAMGKERESHSRGHKKPAAPICTHNLCSSRKSLKAPCRAYAAAKESQLSDPLMHHLPCTRPRCSAPPCCLSLRRFLSSQPARTCLWRCCMFRMGRSRCWRCR